MVIDNTQMKQDVIVSYIREERAKGCADGAIHTELVRTGWADADIYESFQFLNGSSSTGTTKVGDIWLKRCLWSIPSGLAALLVGTVLLFIDQDSGDIAQEPSAFFLIASLFFIPAVLLLLREFFMCTKNLYYRIWVVVLGIVMVVFMPYTLCYFAIQSGLLPVRLEYIEDFGVINFLILLPLQVAAYLLAVITVFIHRHLSKKRGVKVSHPSLIQGFGLMLVAAGVGVFDLFIALGNFHF